ncbi:unnamed protein product [Trichogramma brassicae]|uniref:Uncharacterized protein n=1 Tax=Trichogramma brassicae TaxID=86971 RepID=A0A6H5IBE9_9HYME|nr:unnamed protein product [Trichogramma brassicae]
MHQENTFHPDLVNDVQMEGISCIVSQFYSSTLESRTALIKTIRKLKSTDYKSKKVRKFIKIPCISRTPNNLTARLCELWSERASAELRRRDRSAEFPLFLEEEIEAIKPLLREEFGDIYQKYETEHF